MALLEVSDLSIGFETMRGPIRAVDRLSFSLEAGESLGIVGESGCGKSLTSLAIMGLLPPSAEVTATKLAFTDQDLLSASNSARQKLRGREMAMIFQDPLSSLNPSFNVEFQLLESLRFFPGNKRDRAIELLGQVGIPSPAERLTSFPHQLSGGMSQRVMIAMAIASEPKLLIADEPTTALDVTIQAQILELIRSIQKARKMALILITHDIGVVAKMTKRALVMYAGQKVEEGLTKDLIERPAHPYTSGLLACLPAKHRDQPKRTRLPTIPGWVPDLIQRPSGCQFHPRCTYVQEVCRKEEPSLDGHGTKCFFPLSSAGRK